MGVNDCPNINVEKWFNIGKYFVEEAYSDELFDLIEGAIYYLDKIDKNRIEDIKEALIDAINKSNTYESYDVAKDIIDYLYTGLNK